MLGACNFVYGNAVCNGGSTERGEVLKAPDLSPVCDGPFEPGSKDNHNFGPWPCLLSIQRCYSDFFPVSSLAADCGYLIGSSPIVQAGTFYLFFLLCSWIGLLEPSSFTG